MPNAKPNAPMGYDMGHVPLSQPEEQQMLLYRMNTYRMNGLQPEILLRYMAMPHFVALYLSRNREIVGEILFTGEGGAAKLISLYVMPNYRRMGLAKHLIAAGMTYLSEQGVTYFEADVIRRNVAQCRLGQSCGATFIRTACFYPGINYE